MSAVVAGAKSEQQSDESRTILNERKSAPVVLTPLPIAEYYASNTTRHTRARRWGRTEGKPSSGVNFILKMNDRLR